MSASKSYNPNIYRLRIRKQPPSTLLLLAMLGVLALASALTLAVFALRPFPIEVDLMRAAQELLARSPLVPLLALERQLPLVIPVASLGALVLLLRRHVGDALFLALAMAAGYLLMDVLQRVLARPRPAAPLVEVLAPSRAFAYPSVSVALAVIGSGLMAYLAVRAYRALALAEARDKALLSGVLLVALLLVALSSIAVIALGSHWPSDVLGSYLFGTAYVMLAVLARRQWMKWRGTDKVQ